MLNFTKMTGLGNDYIYINCMNGEKLKNIPEMTRKLSDRHIGIGADGVILIDKPSDLNSDCKMRIFNSDGSEAEMCGNGIMCVAKFIHDKGLSTKDKLVIETLAKTKKVKLIENNGECNEAIVDMGEPIFQDTNIPYNVYEAFNKDLDLNVEEEKIRVTVVSMGNPHAVTFVENLENIDIEKYGPEIENNPIFPNRTNVEFVQIIDKNNVKMRVWERGVGETCACGTGACAAAVASGLNGYTDENVTVKLPGGVLKIEWGKDNHIYMQGPANTIFEGMIEEK